MMSVQDILFIWMDGDTNDLKWSRLVKNECGDGVRWINFIPQNLLDII